MSRIAQHEVLLGQTALEAHAAIHQSMCYTLCRPKWKMTSSSEQAFREALLKKIAGEDVGSFAVLRHVHDRAIHWFAISIFVTSI